MKHIPHMILAFAALAPRLAHASPEEWREQSSKTVEAGDYTSIGVENARGFIRVRPSSDGRIHLTALKIMRANHGERAARVAHETQVVITSEGDRFMVRVHYPQRQELRLGFWQMFRGFEWPRLEVRIGLDVPPTMAVSLKSTSGDLATEDLTGPQRLDTTSGDVSADGAGGTIEASTTSGDLSFKQVSRLDLHSVSGDVDIEGARGGLQARTTSGDVTVRAVSDSISITSVSGAIHVSGAPRGVRARTMSGQIAVQSAAGTVRLESTSGDVTLGLAPPLARADVSTASGDIGLTVAPTVGCAFEMHTSNGTLDASVPLQVKNISRHLMTGVIGNGASPVFLRSSSGDINVKRGGQ